MIMCDLIGATVEWSGARRTLQRGVVRALYTNPKTGALMLAVADSSGSTYTPMFTECTVKAKD